jgi:HNH endonuclease/AP2 domain
MVELVIQGYTVLLDDEDLDRVKALKWSRAGNCQIEGHTYFRHFDFYIGEDGQKHAKTIAMHRFIMGLSQRSDSKMEVDHINGIVLDNRKSNLRLCSHSDNLRNAKKQSNNTSGYRGVNFDKTHGKWRVQISLEKGKSAKTIGRFNTPEEANACYQAKAKEVFGEFYRDTN